MPYERWVPVPPLTPEEIKRLEELALRLSDKSVTFAPDKAAIEAGQRMIERHRESLERMGNE